jgi:hypothetical protein
MTGRKGWDIDLRDGKMAEGTIARLLGDCRIEVKTDEICRRTGKLFVEFQCRGKKSGLGVTTAAYWAFQYDDCKWLIVQTETVRRLATRAYKERFIANGGDEGASKGVLIPIKWFVETELKT